MPFFLSTSFNTLAKVTAASSIDIASSFKADNVNSRDSLTSESIFDQSMLRCLLTKTLEQSFLMNLVAAVDTRIEPSAILNRIVVYRKGVTNNINRAMIY